MTSDEQREDSISPQLEDFLSLLFERSADTIFIFNEKFQYEFISSKTTNGYMSDELMGTNPFDLVHPDDRESEQFKNIIKEDGGKMEIRVKHDNGEWVWVEFRGHSFIAHNGQKKFIIISRNINERKKAEKQLIESEMRYRSLFENSESAITIIDKEGVFLLINKKGADDLGGEPEDFIGKTLFDIFSPEAAEKNFNINLEVFNTGKSLGYTETFDFPTGQKTYIVNVSPIKDVEENTIALQVSAFNITDILEIEQKLRESERKYQDIIEKTKDGIIVIGLDGKFKFFTHQISEMLGGVEITADTGFSFVHPDDAKHVFESFKNALQRKNTASKTTFEFRAKHKDGHYVWLSAAPTNYYDDNGNMIGFISSLRDITEQKKAEQKLRESEEKFKYIVENSNEMIAIFNSKFEYEYMNKALIEIAGYTKEELKTLKPIDLVHPDDLKLLSKAIRDGIIKGGQSVEIRLKNKEGNYFFVDFRAKLYNDIDGNSKVIMIIRKLENR